MRFSVGTRSNSMGSITGIRRNVKARFKGETDREEGNIPFGVFQIHMVPDRDRGLII